MLVAALAIPLAAITAAGGTAGPGLVRLWNLVGALDLVVAMSLGLLSAPGTPFRLFTDGPGSSAMTALPWILIPAILVPVYLLIHRTIAAKLRASQTPRCAAAPAR